ncbi:hypothetical protein SDC9_140654 [bioreactor metagenome]|uniref:Uncharacterized protein n=1 Tax=bioreactor metagenome TaxID=1076179 RepID=A0A645DW06_9ZZZZ
MRVNLRAVFHHVALKRNILPVQPADVGVRLRKRVFQIAMDLFQMEQLVWKRNLVVAVVI